uniref:Uncharacterized protein n=1 Tax=Physcomitrium patens TaxID=3218 RepID=A0A7I4DCE5_PHYPA
MLTLLVPLRIFLCSSISRTMSVSSLDFNRETLQPSAAASSDQQFAALRRVTWY